MNTNKKQPVAYDPMYEFDSPKFYDFANLGMNNSDVCDNWFENRGWFFIFILLVFYFRNHTFCSLA